MTPWVKAHLFWVVVLGLGLLAGRAWLGEHDARLLAEAEVKELNAGIAARDKAARAKVTVIREAVAVASTPAQKAEEIRTLDPRLEAELLPEEPERAKVELQPLLEAVSDGAECKVRLDACEADAGDLRKEVRAEVKRPGFWRRLGHDAKTVGVGVGIGIITEVLVRGKI